jgi:spermidine/putrescine transport system substrate-binding protein
MEMQRFKDRLAAGTLTRRDMSKALAAAGLAAVTMPVHPRKARAAGETTLFTWAGYDIPEVAQPYIETYDGPPGYAIFGEEEEALQKMRAGYTPDLAHPCSYSVGRWRDTGLFKPIDLTRLEHYGDIWEDLKDLPTTQAEGATWFVPWDWGNSSVLFRTDLAPDYAGAENNSWNILFDEKYAGRLAVYDAVDGAVIVAALVAGVADPFNMTDEELAAVEELMIRQRPMLRYYWTDQSSVEQGLASGELIASYAWNSSVVTLKQQGIPVEYMNPKEGILTWVCGLMMLKDGPGDEQASYDLIDAMLAPESGAWLIDNYGYGCSNKKAFDLVSQARLAELGISSPEALFRQGVFFEPIPPERREKYIRMFDDVKAGA